MQSEQTFEQTFSIICLIGIVAFLLVMFGCFPEKTTAYDLGRDSMKKEAFTKGFMKKEIDKDDKVVYKWVELNTNK